MLYERNDIDLKRGTFRVRGDSLEIVSAYERTNGLLIEWFGDEIDRISEVDTITGHILKDKKTVLMTLDGFGKKKIKRLYQYSQPLTL